MNMYQKSFLCWCFGQVLDLPMSYAGEMNNLEKKKESLAETTLPSLMSCRLREGFTLSKGLREFVVYADEIFTCTFRSPDDGV